MIAAIDSPCGRVWISGDLSLLRTVSWSPLDGPGHTGQLDWICTAIDKYFDLREKIFPGTLIFHEGGPVWAREASESHPLNLFHRVLLAISHIPYGGTMAYGDIAAHLGNPGLARAVGQACGKNPLPIIVPCHRVVGKHTLGGFRSGIERKQILLELERQTRARK